jgi:pimeloyl-ACP methyl ester carboxylesterase
MQKFIYFFSGLGADHRAFQAIEIPQAYQPIFIEWLPPLSQESIEEYAQRIAKQFITTPKPILVGLSFDGIIAVEVAKYVQPSQVILISSAKTYQEVPPYYRCLGYLRIHQLLPIQLLKWHNAMTNWFFGAKTIKEQWLLKNILADTPNDFLRWAIHQILTWKNTILPLNYVHSHGTQDKILPLGFVKNCIAIKNGGHLMVLDKANEISKILREVLFNK